MTAGERAAELTQQGWELYRKNSFQSDSRDARANILRAIAIFGEALRLNPRCADAYAYRAMCRSYLRPVGTKVIFGESMLAGRDARRALECGVSDRLVSVLAHFLPVTERRAMLDHRVRGCEDPVQKRILRSNLARTLAELGDFDAAVREFEACRYEDEPALRQCLSSLARAYRAAGRYRDAAETFARSLAEPGSYSDEGVVAEHPGSPLEIAWGLHRQTVTGLVHAWRSCEQWDDALQALQRWSGSLAQPQVRVEEAVLRFLSGESQEQAAKLCEEARVLARDDLQAHFEAGVLAEAAGARRLASRCFKRYLRFIGSLPRSMGATHAWERDYALASSRI